MPDCLVVFGSGSDEAVFRPLMKRLADFGVKAELRILSAHKSPAELSAAVEKSNARIFVAGAGLSAALPGVIASKTIRPVIGVPVNANYSGLDSFLSCSQMPSGIPVLSAGVENIEDAAFAVKAFLDGFEKVEIVQPAFSDFELFEKANDAKLLLEQFGIEFYTRETSKPDLRTVSIHLVELAKTDRIVLSAGRNMRIFVPMAADTSGIGLAAKVLELSTNGLWVGLNRADNAAFAAIQLLNGRGKFSKLLSELRAKARQAVLKSDSESGVRK